MPIPKKDTKCQTKDAGVAAVAITRGTSQSEQGQALVLTTMLMTVVLAFAALVIDIGQLASNRRIIQNAADAAALAGAWQLPDDSGLAVDDAFAWAAQNDVPAGEVTNASVLTTSVANDTMSVTVTRSVDFRFAPVVGIQNQVITATADARILVLNGVTAGKPRVFPYAVWDGNPTKIQMGDTVVFRSNQYKQVNVDPSRDCTSKAKPNCTWDINGNNFKGYFHWQNGYNIYVEPTTQAFSQGGNAFGTSEVDELVKYQLAGIPVILPVVASASNPSGNELNFVITAFVCVLLDPIDTSGSSDWSGEIVKCAANGLYDGPTPPSITGAYVPVLVK